MFLVVGETEHFIDIQTLHKKSSPGLKVKTLNNVTEM